MLQSIHHYLRSYAVFAEHLAGLPARISTVLLL
jgi:hypothetical protein